MTSAERLLYRRRTLLWIVAALLFLGGGLGLAFLLIERESTAREQAIAEANLRGEAVSTLASDVRQLRSQVQAQGETPVAPDPTKAVEDLPDRAEVPVPIPGPPGREGAKGVPGSAGPSGQPGRDGVDGVDGQAGVDGVDGAPGAVGEPGAVGPSGPAGERGEKGEKGDTGEQGPAGPAGQSCPEGYSWQAPADDPDALVCRRDGAPEPEDPGSSPQSLALDPQRRMYA